MCLIGLGMVAPVYNPSFSGGGDQENQGSRPAQWGKFSWGPISASKLGMVVCIYDTGYVEK
jgi:hypothetical protein